MYPAYPTSQYLRAYNIHIPREIAIEIALQQYMDRIETPTQKLIFSLLLSAPLTVIFLCFRHTMAEASAADGKMKDLAISETKKNKKDGNPKTAAKKPQQQKKKVGYAAKDSYIG